MPDLPVGTLLPSNEQEVTTRIKWMNYLQGGGLSILIAIIGLTASSMLFKTIMDDRDEDRQELRESDKSFREQMLKATVEHTTATVRQTTVQEKTNDTLEETKDALVSMAEKIENLADEEKNNAQRLDRILEKAWNQVKTPPSSSPEKITEASK
jgi:septal ring factor EnvC (AmiA/AmiB activator)